VSHGTSRATITLPRERGFALMMELGAAVELYSAYRELSTNAVARVYEEKIENAEELSDLLNVAITMSWRTNDL